HSCFRKCIRRCIYSINLVTNCCDGWTRTECQLTGLAKKGIKASGSYDDHISLSFVISLSNYLKLSKFHLKCLCCNLTEGIFLLYSFYTLYKQSTFLLQKSCI